MPNTSRIPRLRRPSPALVVAGLALSVALGGTSYAAITVTGAQIKDGSITTRDIRDRSLRTEDFARGTKPALASAASAGLQSGDILAGVFDVRDRPSRPGRRCAPRFRSATSCPRNRPPCACWPTPASRRPTARAGAAIPTRSRRPVHLRGRHRQPARRTDQLRRGRQPRRAHRYRPRRSRHASWSALLRSAPGRTRCREWASPAGLPGPRVTRHRRWTR